jgi:rubrerythrin
MGARYAALAAVLATLLFAAASVPVARTQEGATITALQLAVQREFNAKKHYEAFEKRAVSEGLERAACVLRAAARGEAVHLANHLRELERLGGKVELDLESVVVRSTAENLVAAIAGEQLERDQVYRQFADFARRECLYEALANFNYTQGAEATHLEFFQRELALLRETGTDKPVVYADLDPAYAPEARSTGVTVYVCSGCGRLLDARPAKSCPRCGTAGTEAFEIH